MPKHVIDVLKLRRFVQHECILYQQIQNNSHKDMSRNYSSVKGEHNILNQWPHENIDFLFAYVTLHMSLFTDCLV